MKGKSIFLILLAAFAILIISAGPSYAQDIDISNMDNAQLMSLLQAIMDKLESDAETVPQNKGPNRSITETAEAGTFRIYANKKLFTERIPDQYFIQPQNIDKGEDDPSDPGKKKDKIDCNEYCIDQCRYEAGDPMCTANCLAACGS